MNFAFSDEQEELRKAVRRFLEDKYMALNTSIQKLRYEDASPQMRLCRYKAEIAIIAAIPIR